MPISNNGVSTVINNYSNLSAEYFNVTPSASGGGMFEEIITCQTTDDTNTIIKTLKNNAGETWIIEATILARQTDGSNRAYFKLHRCLYRESGYTIYMGNSSQDFVNRSDTSWDAGILWTNNKSGDMNITVVGKAGTTINWKCHYRATKII